MKRIFKKIGVFCLCLSLSTVALAQNTLTDNMLPIILAPGAQTIPSVERTLSYNINANVDFEVSTTADWLTVTRNGNRITINVQANYGGDERSAEITFSNAEKGINRVFTLTQSKDDTASEAPSADHAEYAIFGDKVYSTLREGVTEEDLAKLTNPFIKSLATQLYNGTYKTDYRVADYKCYLAPPVLAARWNTVGKQYNQYEGATGINIPKGKHAVIVSGIPEGESATLRVCAWYVGKVGTNFDGGDPQTTNYQLVNGVNIIDYKNAWDGLAYVCYYTLDNPAQKPAIRVHFVNGEVNGYLSPDKTNKEMHELCKNAKNYCMDAVGDLVHSVWTSEGFYKYCKATDGTQGYRQFMNVLDSLVKWEHDLLGFGKYGLLETPQNRTFAYVNFTYYMFQGALGVSFHRDQEPRVLNCRTIMTRDDDAIWGLSHEWGHQHQIYWQWIHLWFFRP